MRIIVISCNWKHDYSVCIESVKRQNCRHEVFHCVANVESEDKDGVERVDNSTIVIHDSRRSMFLNTFYAALMFSQDFFGAYKNDDIICSVDGDDELYKADTLQYLSTVYNEDVWLTYGSYKHKNSKMRGRYCSRYTMGENYRTAPWRGSHLKTFRYGLYNKINLNDFKHEGKWMPMAGDLALMLPMLEMSRYNQRYISRYMYIYNDGNHLSDHIVDLSCQKRCEKIIRSKTAYEPLLERPW